MSNFQERISEEYDAVSAYIAKHPKGCVLLAAAVFFLIGTFF